MADGRTMRQPTSPEQRWQWWEDAISGKPVETLEREIHCGFFKKRKFRYGEWTKGPWLPARVWLEQEIDPETGELLSDEVYRMEIDGRRVNPWKNWTWIAGHPITEEEWKWLRAMSPLTPDKIPSH